MIGRALEKAIDGMKGMRGEGSGHFPQMMHFVQSFISPGMMKSAVDPVDKAVREQNERHNA